jgi:hypothetical protein
MRSRRKPMQININVPVRIPEHLEVRSLSDDVVAACEDFICQTRSGIVLRVGVLKNQDGDEVGTYEVDFDK